MDDAHRKILQRNRLAIVRGAIIDEDLLSFLMSKNVLKDSMAEEIKSKPVTRDKIGHLLDLLPRRGPAAFPAFIDALVETEQGPLADLLDNAEADRYRQMTNKPSESYYANAPVNAPNGANRSTVPEGPSKDVLPKDSIFPNVNKLQDAKQDKINEVLNDMVNNYPMGKNPRGRCVILNIDKFQKESKKSDREGSYTDVTNLTQVFQKLHFTVDLWDNLTGKEIRERLKEERNREDHKDSDMFVMAIFSHGKENIVFGIDGDEVQIKEEFLESFNGTKCRGLVNKPKVFFIQACQGSGTSRGVVADDDTERPPEDKIDALKIPDEGSGEGAAVHEWADMLVVLGTVPGYKAWRNIIEGSWFITDLTRAIVEYAHYKHLEEIITIVTRYVNDRSRDKTGHKQICQKTGQLRRNLHFLPGYVNSTAGPKKL